MPIDIDTKQFIIMQEDIKYIQKDVKELTETIRTFIEKADEKYAGKWVEKVWWGAAGIIGSAILVAVLSLVLKK